MRLVILISIYALIFSQSCNAQETSHYNVVAEFIRELGDTKTARDSAMMEVAQNEGLEGEKKIQQTLIDAIHNCTKVDLQLNTSNYMLKSMYLEKPFETLIPSLITFNNQKIKLYEEMKDISKTIMSGPKPGVDYSVLAGRMPEIRAELEYVDKSIYQISPLIFALLIDDKPDNQNRLSHLNITKDERNNLIKSIKNYFGSSLEEKDQTWIASSAYLLRSQLTDQGYKSSDDGWK